MSEPTTPLGRDLAARMLDDWEQEFSVGDPATYERIKAECNQRVVGVEQQARRAALDEAVEPVARAMWDINEEWTLETYGGTRRRPDGYVEWDGHSFMDEAAAALATPSATQTATDAPE